MKILLIEDDHDVRRVLRLGLESLGQKWQLFESETGEKGWTIIQQQKPDLVLLDLNLPGMSGDVILTTLRRSVAFRDVKVIILSAQDPDEVQQVAKLGANGYLIKPFRVDELRQVIKKVMGEKAFPAGDTEGGVGGFLV